ncbi:hypothetical protein A2U01_0101231, partial [Trifolium medium]|nr:hypothetical protein [Trifolium medium]
MTTPSSVLHHGIRPPSPPPSFTHPHHEDITPPSPPPIDVLTTTDSHSVSPSLSCR